MSQRNGPVEITVTGSSDPRSLFALGLESLLSGKRELGGLDSELRSKSLSLILLLDMRLNIHVAFKHLFSRQSLNASATASQSGVNPSGGATDFANGHAGRAVPSVHTWLVFALSCLGIYVAL